MTTDRKSVQVKLIEDLEVVCKECGDTFTFERGEQIYYRENGLTPPKRCRQCRAWNRFRHENGKAGVNNGNGS